MCYSTFEKLKPSWIAKLKLSDKDTCACNKYEHFQSLIDTLHNLNLVSTKIKSNIAKTVCCNLENKSCIYRTWPKCQSKKAFSVEENIMNNLVEYEQ